jgi:hypothetical protein
VRGCFILHVAVVSKRVWRQEGEVSTIDIVHGTFIPIVIYGMFIFDGECGDSKRQQCDESEQGNGNEEEAEGRIGGLGST